MGFLTMFVVLFVVIGLNTASKCPNLEFRGHWQALTPKKLTPFMGKPAFVIIKETGIVNDDEDLMSRMQKENMNVQKSDDIDCSFVFGHFGTVFEGRGWFNAVVGNNALVFCVMGKFDTHGPTDAQKSALKEFFNCPDSKILMNPNYKIVTLRDMNSKSNNPNNYLYEFVKKLPHYQKASPTSDYDYLWQHPSAIIG